MLVVLAVLALYVIKPRRASAPLPRLGTVGEFSLTNQFGQTVTRAQMAGQIWVANIIFTRCAGPCPQLTRQMGKLQSTIAADKPVRFVSLTADPEFDTPEILRKYGERYGVDSNRWHFLTGSKASLYQLALDGLKLAVAETGPDRQPGEDLFIHSMKFAVVDAQGNLRAFIDGEQAGAVSELNQAVAALLQEMKSR